MLDEMNDEQKDLAQVVRFALAEQTEDVRLFVARLVRKYRNSNPELAEQLNVFLRSKQSCTATILRKALTPTTADRSMDAESRLLLLKVFKDFIDCDFPFLSADLEESL